MSNVDHFIEEVTEEVRRDRLLLLMRRYGWIAILFAVLIVAGAATNEYLNAQERAKAEALGDEILAAVQVNDAAERANALAAITTDSAGKVVAMLQTAAEQFNAEDNAAAMATLSSIVNDETIEKRFRDLAQFKLLSLSAAEMSIADRRRGYEALAVSAYRLLVEEQLALLAVEEGNTDDALVMLRAILEDNETSAGLRRRASQLIVALGGTLGAA
ncbi:MAG: hypothetical protein ABJO67_01740 [Pseudoruegeria sp.]